MVLRLYYDHLEQRISCWLNKCSHIFSIRRRLYFPRQLIWFGSHDISFQDGRILDIFTLLSFLTFLSSVSESEIRICAAILYFTLVLSELWSLFLWTTQMKDGSCIHDKLSDRQGCPSR